MFSTCIDRSSHNVTVYLQKLKSETSNNLKGYMTRREMITGEHTNFLRSNSGGKYGSDKLAAWLKSKGIHHKITNAYTPQENSVAEHMNHTLIKKVHTMLNNTGLPHKYWGDVLLHTAHLVNVTPTCALLGEVTLHEAFTGNKPDVSSICIFGCKAYIHIPEAWHNGKL